MGYSQLTFASVADQITQLEAAMISAGWTDTGLNGSLGSSSGNILVSSADADGRVCYSEFYVDTGGRLALHSAPLLNSGGTDLDDKKDYFRAADFQAGTWECFIYDDFVHCGRGIDPDNYFFWLGRLTVFPNVSFAIHKFACTMMGTHGIDGGAALRPRPLNRSGSGIGVFTTKSWTDPIWQQIGIFIPALVTASTYNGGYGPDIGFLDDATLFCAIPILGGVVSALTADHSGILGYIPHALIVMKDTILAVGDRVSVDSGATMYRLPYGGNEKDYYAEQHLLWEE